MLLTTGMLASNLSQHRICRVLSKKYNRNHNRSNRNASARCARMSSTWLGCNFLRRALARLATCMFLAATCLTLLSSTRGRWNRSPSSQSGGLGEGSARIRRRGEMRSLRTCTRPYELCRFIPHWRFWIYLLSAGLVFWYLTGGWSFYGGVLGQPVLPASSIIFTAKKKSMIL